MIRTNDEIFKKELPQINRPFLKRLNASYLPEIRQKKKQDGKDDQRDAILSDNQVEKLLQQPTLELNLKDMFIAFDKELPPYPEEPQVYLSFYQAAT